MESWMLSRLKLLLMLDGLKTVERRTYLRDGSRHENSAEHSWHLAMYVIVFAPLLRERGVDVEKVLRMAILHDFPEVLAGDTFVYDEQARAAAKAEERRAAETMLALLPREEAAELLALLDEYEAGETLEARTLSLFDRLQPMLQNIASGGRAWREHGITADRVERRNGPVFAEFFPELWEHVRSEIRRVLDGAAHTA